VGEPKGRRLFEGDLNLLYGRLLQADVRNPIGQGFGQVVCDSSTNLMICFFTAL
jgi:hypothetical protein